MIDKRKQGGIKGKGIPKDKMSRKLVLKKTNYVRSAIIIANVYNFKTTQIEINGWIKLHNPNYEQSEVNCIFNRIKKNIKNHLTEFGKTTGKYKKENLVIIDTGKQTKMNKIRNYQFLNIDIVLFNQSVEYDKAEVRYYIIPVVKTIIENDLNVEEFSFIEKLRGSEQFTNE